KNEGRCALISLHQFFIGQSAQDANASITTCVVEAAGEDAVGVADDAQLHLIESFQLEKSRDHPREVLMRTGRGHGQQVGRRASWALLGTKGLEACIHSVGDHADMACWIAIEASYLAPGEFAHGNQRLDSV